MGNLSLRGSISSYKTKLSFRTRYEEKTYTSDKLVISSSLGMAVSKIHNVISNEVRAENYTSNK
jgi:hypothetical protein